MRRVLALPIVLAAVLAAGCGGGGGGSVAGGTPPEEWATSVCGALQTWTSTLQSRSQELSSGLSGSSGVPEIKQKLVDFMDGAVQATDTMIADVDAAGAPDVDKGEQFQADLKAGLEKAKTSFEQAKKKAEGLPTDNPAAFGKGAQELGSTLQTEGTQIETTLKGLGDKYDVPELDKAFDKEPACKSL